MRIASTCNLHAIASVHPDSSALTSPSILAPATNELELYDRINAFWGAFILDRAGSICSGLEVALSDDVCYSFWRLTSLFCLNLGLPEN
jgi:hypothetical protein